MSKRHILEHHNICAKEKREHAKKLGVLLSSGKNRNKAIQIT